MAQGYMGLDNSLSVLSNIGIYRGDLLQIEINVVNEYNRPISLETVVVTFKICDVQDEEIVYLSKDGEIKVSDESVAVVTLLSQDTADFTISKYRYIVEINYETGDKNIGKGFITIL